MQALPSDDRTVIEPTNSSKDVRLKVVEVHISCSFTPFFSSQRLFSQLVAICSAVTTAVW